LSLDRFIDAQNRIWPAPLEEIRAGCKTGHWMWFVFPQLRGLGHSPMAHRYGIEDLTEARAYLEHAVLGPRLEQICRAMLAHRGSAAEAILGPVDAMKLRSCATLFEAARGASVFGEILVAFADGRRCRDTLRMIGRDRSGPTGQA